MAPGAGPALMPPVRFGALPVPEGRFRLRTRIESEPGERGFASLLLTLGQDSLLVALRRVRDGAWEEGLGRFDAAADAVPARVLATELRFRPARLGTARALGAIGGNPAVFRARLEGLLYRCGRRVGLQRGSYRPGGTGEDGVADPHGRVRARAFMAMRGLGYAPDEAETEPYADAAADPRPLPRAWAPGESDPAADLSIDAHLADAVEATAEWREGLASLLRPSGIAFLPEDAWSGRLAGFLMADGNRGRYRRQAAALYPSLAPLMATDVEVAAAIDEGRRFEGALAERLASLCPGGGGERFTVAKLRTLRGFAVAGIGLSEFLDCVALTPLDRLPSDPEGWADAFGRKAFVQVHRIARNMGLAGARLVPRPGSGPRLDARAFVGMGDMAERCAGTLVAPLLGIAGDSDEAVRVAARMLFGEGDIGDAHEASLRWHAGLAAFDALMPVPGEGVAWPALFPPQRHGSLVIVALTTPRQLRDEGLHEADDEGVAGLAHCVGGYAARCSSGECHVVSVRRDDGGRCERLSTAELRIPARTSAFGIQPVGLAQHRGRGNAEPPPEAVAALGSVLDGIGRGNVPIDPAARERRGPSAYLDGIDWGDPEALASSLRAWRPHLRRGIVRRGPDGLRTLLSGFLSEAAIDGGTRGVA